MTKVSDRKPYILIIEDSQESIDLLYYFLEPEGYKLKAVTTAQEGIQVIEKERPDLILLDIMLPDMDGYQICDQIKKNPKTFYIPVIVLTALKELKHKIKAYEAGADDFITKPFDSIELLARVRSLLKVKRLYETLDNRNKELEEKNRLLEKEDKLKQDLIDLIVHDMKNPLFVIQGNIQMMEMLKQIEDPKLQKYIHRIERSTRNLLRMILNLLDISRLENDMIQLQLVKTNIIELFKNKISFFEEMGEFEGFHLEISYLDDIVEKKIDSDLFGRVVENLIGFFINNTRTGGKIQIQFKKEDHNLFIYMFHQGSVIPAQFKEKVFEKYAQLELKKAGFKPAKGLGLIFCKMALEKMGMDISLDSSSQDGNRFMLKIPLEG